MNVFRATLILILLFHGSVTTAQTQADSISITWTKYIITNDKNEVMLRYDEYYKAWELEGCGYEGPITFKNLMDTLADFLGIKYDSYKLGGVFSYFRPGRYRAVIKPYYVVHFTGYSNGKNFAEPEKTKWVSRQKRSSPIPPWS